MAAAAKVDLWARSGTTDKLRPCQHHPHSVVLAAELAVTAALAHREAESKAATMPLDNQVGTAVVAVVAVVQDLSMLLMSQAIPRFHRQLLLLTVLCNAMDPGDAASFSILMCPVLS